MSLEKLTSLYSSDREHEHLLDSDRFGWDKLGLIYELEPAGEMPEAVTLTHTLIVCLDEFKASFHIEGKWHDEHYTKGDIVLFPAGELFPRVKTDREVPLIDLFLPPDILVTAIGKTVAQTRLRSQLKLQDPLIQQMALALKAELATAGEDSKLYADSMATALGAHLLQRYGIKNSIVKEYQGGLAPHQLKIVLEYIQEHLDRTLSLDLLASLINISPHYFANLFKQSTSIPPHKYITQCRLEKAKTLLHHRDLPIAFICQEVGFKNQSHFTRVFRQQFHITPKAYRDLF